MPSSLVGLNILEVPPTPPPEVPPREAPPEEIIPTEFWDKLLDIVKGNLVLVVAGVFVVGVISVLLVGGEVKRK